MTISCNSDTLPFCCGINDIGGFTKDGDYYETIKYLEKSGTGLYTASFVDTNVCKKAYEELCDKFTLLYQSPPKRNTNSGRKVFLCVFADKSLTING